MFSRFRTASQGFHIYLNLFLSFGHQRIFVVSLFFLKDSQASVSYLHGLAYRSRELEVRASRRGYRPC